MSLGTILIIGGSSGIGLGVAAAALAQGAERVVLSSSNAGRLSAAADSLAAQHPGPRRVFHHVADLADLSTQEAQLTELLQYSVSAEVTGTADGQQTSSSKISHIVFTAGEGLARQSLADFDPRRGLDHFPVRYVAPLTLAKLAPAYMVSGPEASITFTSGSSTRKPSSKGIATLIGAAGALEVAALALAVELAPIRVNTVLPGAIDTPLLGKILGEGKEAREMLQKMVEADTLLQRVGNVEECAQAYLYFMRDRLQTGTALVSDGGRILKGIMI